MKQTEIEGTLIVTKHYCVGMKEEFTANYVILKDSVMQSISFPWKDGDWLTFSGTLEELHELAWRINDVMQAVDFHTSNKEDNE